VITGTTLAAQSGGWGRGCRLREVASVRVTGSAAVLERRVARTSRSVDAREDFPYAVGAKIEVACYPGSSPRMQPSWVKASRSLARMLFSGCRGVTFICPWSKPCPRGGVPQEWYSNPRCFAFLTRIVLALRPVLDSRASREAESLVPRQQLTVLDRKSRK
jgi:hypothetical protein